MESKPFCLQKNKYLFGPSVKGTNEKIESWINIMAVFVLKECKRSLHMCY